MNVQPGFSGSSASARTPEVDNSRLRHLAEMAEQLDDEERAQSSPDSDQFHVSVQRRPADRSGSAFHPYRRETAQPASRQLRTSLSEESRKIQQSTLSLLDAILRTPNPKDRSQMLESILGSAHSKTIQARRMAMSALVGHTTNINTRLDHPDFDLNVKGPALQTLVALHQAVRLGHLDVVKAILEHPKVTPELVNSAVPQSNLQHSVLLSAMDCGQNQIARYLLGHPKVNVNQPSGNLSMTPLYMAIVKNPALVKDVLNHPQLDLGISAERPQGAVALVAAAYFNQTEIFDQLLDHPKMSKDIVNCTNPKGENALYKILFHSRNEFAQKLRQHPQFDLNHRLPSGETALVKAAEVGNLKAVQQYLQEGSLDLAANDQDVEALLVAGIEGHSLIYDLLKHAAGMWSLHVMPETLNP
jgi:ankyrin repeat protein